MRIVVAASDEAVIVDASDGERVGALVVVGIGATDRCGAETERAGDFLSVLLAGALVVGVEAVFEGGGTCAEGEGGGATIAGAAEGVAVAIKALAGTADCRLTGKFGRGIEAEQRVEIE